MGGCSVRAAQQAGGLRMAVVHSIWHGDECIATLFVDGLLLSDQRKAGAQDAGCCRPTGLQVAGCSAAPAGVLLLLDVGGGS